MISKKSEIILLILLPSISFLLALIFKPNFFTLNLLFFGPLAVWLSFLESKKIKKIFLFSLISIPLGIFIDYVGVASRSWIVPKTIFSFRLFRMIPIEDLIWAFLIAYTIIIFYEHFLDKGQEKPINKKIRYLLWLVSVLLASFLIILCLAPGILAIKYAYLWLGVIFVLIPPVVFLLSFPKLFSKFAKTAVYFFLFNFLFEFAVLKLGYWQFPGKNFIGWVDFLGYRFPFEEFFFLILIGAFTVLTYYEFFADDKA
jgi:hypothetical protein